MEHILKGGDDSAPDELLDEFFDGYPIDKLRLLLQSNVEQAVVSGAWIASELGRMAAPLIDELSQMLDHPSREVRFYLLDPLLCATAQEHGEAIARAVLLVRDADEAVRWKVVRFLARATREQLTAAVPHLDSDRVATLLTWLLSSGNTIENKRDIVTRLNDADPLVRLFAAAAAARLEPDDLGALERAAASTDPEIRSFAESELEILTIREESRRSGQARRRLATPEQVEQREDDMTV
jgi:hypothetical protein